MTRRVRVSPCAAGSRRTSAASRASPTWCPDLTGVTGSLNADLTLGGTLGQPGVKGQAALRGFGAEVPLLGLKVANLNLNLAGPDHGPARPPGQGRSAAAGWS